MKRSEINAAVRHAKSLFEQYRITLPFFGYMTLEDWNRSDLDYSILKRNMMGWDVTSFGSDDFTKFGSTLFTVRNGNIRFREEGPVYAEKYIIMDASGQEIPMHYHVCKSEDIINRAGAVLKIQVYMAAPDNSLDMNRPVELWCDGIKRSFAPGEIISVTNGNSVRLTPYVYHRFYAEGGDVVVGEVSSLNDDTTDNIFLNGNPRFNELEEDEPVEHLLCNEYDLIRR